MLEPRHGLHRGVLLRWAALRSECVDSRARLASLGLVLVRRTSEWVHLKIGCGVVGWEFYFELRLGLRHGVSFSCVAPWSECVQLRDNGFCSLGVKL